MSLMGTLDKPYDLLLGRKTYDIFAGYWPKVPADNPIGPVFTKANNMYRPGARRNSTGPTATNFATLTD
jgi:dihydrofolate reductase